MNSEEIRIKDEKDKQIQNIQRPDISRKMTEINELLPFNIATDLNEYKRMYITKEFDYFKIVHCCQNIMPEYKIYGQLPDGDIKLLFTCSQHFEWNICDCCNHIVLTFYCCSYVFCDSIVFQLDYRRNQAPFYTQGLNIQKGFYCCQCYCCACCTCCSRSSKLFLRENTKPDDPDFNQGIQKGNTDVDLSCCTPDYIATYITERNEKGYGVRAKCCEICQHCCLKWCCGLDCDFKINIEDDKGKETDGNVMIYSGFFSEKVKDKCLYLPRRYFTINLPSGASSEQKFQIVADLIHYDIIHRVL